MANEVVEDLRRGGRSGLCLKVDFEKAYDSVRWDFLYDMLQRMGFHNRWILWIRGCMESASVSVLVNGSPTEEFIPSRGLRQGDPLAPFLFLVVAEGLTGLVREAVKANLLTGLKIGRKGTLMSLLQFADDTLFFCEDSFINVVTLKAILRGFELASGLKSTSTNQSSQVLMSLIKTLNATPRL
ncbi:secreted RxLR effector protein 78-like [Phaseolus vulgaris]|uniref:secreted RxLR effector protein 78-like n=1 Tax=Phaseolus vulgaris TaxID=3885 RepID=UPI0035CB03B4